MQIYQIYHKKANYLRENSINNIKKACDKIVSSFKKPTRHIRLCGVEPVKSEKRLKDLWVKEKRTTFARAKR